MRQRGIWIIPIHGVFLHQLENTMLIVTTFDEKPVW